MPVLHTILQTQCALSCGVNFTVLVRLKQIKKDVNEIVAEQEAAAEKRAAEKRETDKRRTKKLGYLKYPFPPGRVSAPALPYAQLRIV